MPQAERPITVHQAGERHIEALRAVYASADVTAECVPFIDDMAARYAWADVVVCRGGALTVTELAAVGLGAIIVPLPGAIADEQTAKALRFLLDRRCGDRAAAIGTDRPDGAAGRSPRFADARRCPEDGARRHRVGKRDAADRVADVCVALAGASVEAP